MEHFLFSHQALSGQSAELHTLHFVFSEHRQHARPHLAIPNSLFITLTCSLATNPVTAVDVTVLWIPTYIDVFLVS